MKVELGLFNYVTKTVLKNATGTDTSSCAKKVDLVSLKSNVDLLDIDKLKNVPTNLSNLKSKVEKLDIAKLLPAPIDLSKLSNVLKNDVVKNIYIYNTKVKNIEDKVPSDTNLATKVSLNAQINELEGETRRISNLIKQADIKQINKIEKKMTDHNHDKYIATTEFKTLT